jgi:hypothetical protein
MSIHHAMIVHGSQPNLSKHQRRIGFALQSFMPTGARQTIGKNYWSPVRGRCAQASDVALKRPNHDMDPTGIAERNKANKNFSDILYHGAKTKRDY